MMYGYIYKTTNLINGKIYIGQHKSFKFDSCYYGSGKYFINALHKYGKENFEVEMIESCKSKKELNEREIYWISVYRNQKFQMYNIAKGGEGGDLVTCLSDIEYKNFCNHMSELNKQGIIGNKGKQLSAQHKERIGLGNKGKIHSEEWKRKHDNAVRGKPAWNKGLTQDDVRVRKYIHKKGEFHHLLETRKLISEHTKGIKKTFKNPEKRLENMRTAQQKRVRSKKESEHARTIAIGRIWINNEIISKMIYPNELEQYLEQGYKLGRLSFKERK